jgi:hypothetical protein
MGWLQSVALLITSNRLTIVTVIVNGVMTVPIAGRISQPRMPTSGGRLARLAAITTDGARGTAAAPKLAGAGATGASPMKPLTAQPIAQLAA